MKFKYLFNGTLGAWKSDPVDFGLKEDEKTICLRPYPLPTVHTEMLKKEVERLFRLGVLKVANDLEWGSPYFTQPKPQSNRVGLLSDFRNLNKQLKRKIYPIPKSNEMLLKLEGF